VARWCVGSRVETTGGVFQVREGREPAPAWGGAAADAVTAGEMLFRTRVPPQRSSALNSDDRHLMRWTVIAGSSRSRPCQLAGGRIWNRSAALAHGRFGAVPSSHLGGIGLDPARGLRG
jgi:hypothetical protein